MSEQAEFGVTVKRPGEPLPSGYGADTGDWALYLPHSCDEWLIGADADKAAVLSAAKEFRAELDNAIAVLES